MVTVKAHRAETKLTEDGSITLRDLPFRRGDLVEVIVMPSAGVPEGSRYPLRGLPVELIEPTEPVSADDWNAAQ